MLPDTFGISDFVFMLDLTENINSMTLASCNFNSNGLYLTRRWTFYPRNVICGVLQITVTQGVFLMSPIYCLKIVKILLQFISKILKCRHCHIHYLLLLFFLSPPLLFLLFFSSSSFITAFNTHLFNKSFLNCLLSQLNLTYHLPSCLPSL